MLSSSFFPVVALGLFFMASPLAAQEADDPGARVIPDIKDAPIFRDPGQPMDRRIDDVIRRLSLEEKVKQLVNGAGGIERLGIPAYNYWNECLHGVARDGIATVFPEPTGLAATWDVPLAHATAEAISTEARAKYNATDRDKAHAQYQGLTFWTPNLNIYRDPRWGRGQETYGEDPYLTSRLGVAFIEGLQGNNPVYLKVAACAKHFAVHSGPEPGRHQFDASPPERDLYETYLPQFEAAVKEGKVATVMAAYNSLYKVPAACNPFLLQDLLRKQWGFTGQVVSDCGAVASIVRDHKYLSTPPEGVASAIQAGLDLECGGYFSHLVESCKEGLVTEAEIDRALHLDLAVRFQLGMFDPPGRNPYDEIAPAENDTAAHRALALKSAEESIVLLKNADVLPLDPAKLRQVAVIGANADSVPVLLGNYNGTPSAPVTFLQGIRNQLGPKVKVVVATGCPLALKPGESFSADSPGIRQAVDAANGSDAVIYIGGISAQLEGEEMKVNYEGFNGGDRTQIELPSLQTDLLKALAATHKPVIFVDCSGGAVAMPWEAENLPAILQVWYPGEEGGTALANVIFGNYNPGGRLPVTFYQATQDLPPFTDYAMTNRTYRYFAGKPLFPFGYGLSYTHFDYTGLQASAEPVAGDGTIHVQVNVRNSGTRDGDEVVQCYARHLDSKIPQPIHSLVGFQRISLAAGQSTLVNLDIPVNLLRYWDVDKKAYVVEPGRYEMQVGASSADLRGSVGVEIGG
jgi:beta-glucosidase